MPHYRSCGCVVENDVVLMPCAKHSRPRDPDAVQAEIINVLEAARAGLETEMLRVLLTERNTAFGLLRKYGRHLPDCQFTPVCTCGWDAVFKMLEGK